MGNGSNTHILLVDDEGRLVENLSRLLSKQGYIIHKASNGAEALDELKRSPCIQVVVMDLVMPIMNGMEALGEIKTRHPDKEVIILTGNASFVSGAEALRLGAFDYLTKPCDMEDIVRTIENALEYGKIRRKPAIWAGSKVRQVMHPLFEMLTRDHLLTDAFNLYQKADHYMIQERLYITDGRDRLVGYITRDHILFQTRIHHPGKDIEWDDLLGNPGLLPPIPLGNLVQPEIIAADPEESLAVVGKVLVIYNLRSMPVVENDRVVGVIRLPDIWQYIQHEFDENGKGRDANGSQPDQTDHP